MMNATGAGRPNVVFGHTWEPSARASAITIGLLTLLAALLRLIRLDHAPPGLNQDEAVNAWNAFCLLRTGRDMVGSSWPVFYAHAIGDNRTTLLFYWLIPFQALGGLGVVSARAAVAVSGVLCVPLLYFVASKWFGHATALTAAALLAINPWHVGISRLAIEGGILPLFGLATLALMWAAGFPLAERGARPARPWVAALAGIVGGIGCYGYWAERLYFPALLALLLLFGARRWRDLSRAPRGAHALALFALGLAATLGPLAWRHVVDPEIAVRSGMTRLWEPGSPISEILRRVIERYAIHFGPGFLFVRGDYHATAGPTGHGAFGWPLLPLMLMGLGVTLRSARGSAAHATLLALVLAYPAGDLIARYQGVHPFRSAPGIAALVLLAAVGAVASVRWLARRRRALAWTAAALLGLTTVFSDYRHYVGYFGAWPARPDVYRYFHGDVMEACGWLRPRLRAGDRVFWTAERTNMPFAITLVGLGYDPRRWLADEKDMRIAGGWDGYVRYGNMYFLYGQLCRPYVDVLEANGRTDHAYFVVRPHELGLQNPVHVLLDPAGKESLWICEGNL